MANQIRHQGQIISIDNQLVHVEIVANSACASCHAKSVCMPSEQKKRVVDAPYSKDDNLMVGDLVDVIIHEKSAFKSVWLCYILPLCLMLFFMFFVLWLTKSQDWACFACIFSLIPYYLGLYFYSKTHKIINFSVEKI